MKVIVDEKIPYIREAIERIADEVVYAAGREITPAMVKDADALIVRTRTRCDRELLEGSRVRFIATATIGYDHIDTAYCKEAGIAWVNAPGCNAGSVAQYVQSVLLLLQKEKGIRLRGATLGIVGVGHVGCKVEQVAAEFGMHVLRCDPPREEREGKEGFCSLQRIAEESDIVTFHVPLTYSSQSSQVASSQVESHPTFHLADAKFFRSLRRRPMLINTSRGEVVETAALLSALEQGEVSDAVLDVWEHEPDIDRALLNKVYIGTPHIAGYSADGKANATRMALQALIQFIQVVSSQSSQVENYPTDYLTTNYLTTIQPPAPATPVITARSMEDAYLQMYDPRRDSEALKSHPEQFETLRGNYPLRREKEAYTVMLKGE